MLQVVDNSIQEYTTSVGTSGGALGTGDMYYSNGYPYHTVYWNSYPVYVCTDKTKKAIDILKALQAEKLLECKSVLRFIELVEKISNLL